MVTSFEAMWRNSCSKGHKNSLNNTSSQLWATFQLSNTQPISPIISGRVPKPKPDSGTPTRVPRLLPPIHYDLESFVTVTDVLIGRKLTGHRRWTQVTCVRGSSCNEDQWGSPQKEAWHTHSCFGVAMPVVSSPGPAMTYASDSTINSHI